MIDLANLLVSWQRAMRSEHKSAATIKTYGAGVAAFLLWCQSTGNAPVLDRATVQEFIASLLESGAEPATAHARHKALRRFAAWLVTEGELDTDPLLGAKPPQVGRKVTPALSDDQLKALIKACAGKSLRDRRDEALVRLMAETGARAGEVIALQVADVDLDRGLVVIRRGKGAKGRVAPISPQAVTAIDRYLRSRRTHRLADTGALWVGAGGKTFGYSALRDGLRDRAVQAGIAGFHPHLLRHTAATRWLRAGGSEGGLMAVAGWSSRSMLDRYTAASASERAAAEARGLNLGEL
jgi:site-specific recombinase XerD